MPTKKRTRRTEPHHFHPRAGILPSDTRRSGLRVQLYACTPAGLPVHCGVHYVDPRRISRELWRLEMHWRRWRRWYDNLPAHRDLDYPAKEGPRAAHLLVAFPVNDPKTQTVLRLPA